MRNRRRDACAVVRRKGKRAESICSGTQKGKTGRKHMQWHAEKGNGQKAYAVRRRKTDRYTRIRQQDAGKRKRQAACASDGRRCEAEYEKTIGQK